MDKYELLFILNVPFVFFGVLKTIMAYRTKISSWPAFLLRLLFWLLILLVLIFAGPIYNYLYRHGLTDSTPLSIADVVLTTGVMVCLSLCLRLYGKIDKMDKRLSDLHEKLSIYISTKD